MAARELKSVAYRALLCSLPPGRLSGNQKLGSWAVTCYLTLGQLLLCITHQKNQLNTTQNQLSHFLVITGTLVCIATYLRDLWTPGNSVPQRCGMPLPHPPLPVLCLCLKNCILEASSPINRLVGPEWTSCQENTHVSAWQT